MFGLTSSAGVFGSVADMLVDIYKVAGFWPTVKWVDDFFVVQQPGQSWTEADFIETTSKIGIPWSSEKTRPLSHVQRYIGFDWNLETRSVSIPIDKLQRIRLLLHSWIEDGGKFSATEAASLHGRLVHISCIFPLIRPFLRSIAAFAANFQSHRAKLHPPSRVVSDLRWTLNTIEMLPNELPLLSSSPTDIDWWGDASTSFGIGITVGSLWAVWRWKQGVKIGPRQQYDIGWAEAVAVELALRIAIEFKHLETGHYLVLSDNMGVVSVLNSGRSRSKETNEILKQVYFLLAKHRLQITAKHVPSRLNVTDALSRGDITAFLKGFPKAASQVNITLPPHLLSLLEPFQYGPPQSHPLSQ